MIRPRRALIAPAALLWSGAAQAQGAATPGLHVEFASDERVRGLSWSDGKPAMTVGGYAPLADGLEVSAAMTTLRNSVRHAGADAGLRLAAKYSRPLGPWRLAIGATGHVFPGQGAMNFIETGAQAGYQIGPLGLRARADYAPPQQAIGGSNLHIAIDADVAVPGTAWTLFGGIGRSSGSVDDAGRAARLRPRGAYRHHSLGAEHIRGPLVIGARWTGTSIGGGAPAGRFADRHTGSRLSAYLRLEL